MSIFVSIINRYTYKDDIDLAKQMIDDPELYGDDCEHIFDDNSMFHDIWIKYKFKDRENIKLIEYIKKELGLWEYGKKTSPEMVHRIYEELGYNTFIEHLKSVNNGNTTREYTNTFRITFDDNKIIEQFNEQFVN